MFVEKNSSGSLSRVSPFGSVSWLPPNCARGVVALCMVGACALAGVVIRRLSAVAVSQAPRSATMATSERAREEEVVVILSFGQQASERWLKDSEDTSGAPSSYVSVATRPVA